MSGASINQRDEGRGLKIVLTRGGVLKITLFCLFQAYLLSGLNTLNQGQISGVELL